MKNKMLGLLFSERNELKTIRKKDWDEYAKLSWSLKFCDISESSATHELEHQIVQFVVLLSFQKVAADKGHWNINTAINPPTWEIVVPVSARSATLQLTVVARYIAKNPYTN